MAFCVFLKNFFFIKRTVFFGKKKDPFFSKNPRTFNVFKNFAAGLSDRLFANFGDFAKKRAFKIALKSI